MMPVAALLSRTQEQRSLSARLKSAPTWPIAPASGYSSWLSNSPGVITGILSGLRTVIGRCCLSKKKAFTGRSSKPGFSRGSMPR